MHFLSYVLPVLSVAGFCRDTIRTWCAQSIPVPSLSHSSLPMSVSCFHRVPTPSPLSLCVAKACRNHLNDEITPLGQANDI